MAHTQQMDFRTLLKKHTRRSVGFGAFRKKEREFDDEVHLRELSISHGGVGCAVWDAAIILARWLHEQGVAEQRAIASPTSSCSVAPALRLHGRSVMELGAGVGLPGLVAAWFAERVWLTDYLDTLLENLRYNVQLNANEDDAARPERARAVASAARVHGLDWDCFVRNDASDDSESARETRSSLVAIPARSVDLLIGSELVYVNNRDHIHSLLAVVDHFMAPHGAFYSIQSDDRDGVPIMCEMARAMGFCVDTLRVPDHLLGNYGTNQLPETYHFYTIRRRLVPAREGGGEQGEQEEEEKEKEGEEGKQEHQHVFPVCGVACTTTTTTTSSAFGS